MARVRSKNTQPELLLRRALWRIGCRYRLYQKLPGKPDIVFSGLRIAVFVDGCFWHRCPKHYKEPVRNAGFWRAKIERNVCRDRIADEQLRAAGWMVLRFWEHEILSDIEAVVRKVEEVLQERRAV